jgi:hypothetical protein
LVTRREVTVGYRPARGTGRAADAALDGDQLLRRLRHRPPTRQVRTLLADLGRRTGLTEGALAALWTPLLPVAVLGFG